MEQRSHLHDRIANIRARTCMGTAQLARYTRCGLWWVTLRTEGVTLRKAWVIAQLSSPASSSVVILQHSDDQQCLRCAYERQVGRL